MRPGDVNENAVCLERAANFAGRAKRRVNLEPNQIRLNVRRIKTQARRVGDHLRDDLGIAMVLRQALDVMVQGIERRRGEAAGLAHTAAE